MPAMIEQRRVTPITTYLGYDPGVSAIRLAADVAHAHLSRTEMRPTRTPLHVREREIRRRGGSYRPVHWSELPRFVRARAREKGIDIFTTV